MGESVENGEYHRGWLLEPEISNEGPVTIVLGDFGGTALSSLFGSLLDASVLTQIVTR
jgi:hypothetical protein